jgi:AcrR family transcriptional regulator
MSTDEPSLLGRPGRERADAARNRRAVLAAAARLMSAQGPEAVTMDHVAEAAGVGKGTLYRRFGDRQGLLLALLDDAERELQDAILRGKPPLGPGAPVEERLIAFLRALVDLLEQRGEVVRASETSSPGARVRGGAYRAWHLHVALLLAELRPGSDSHTLAHVLLAPLAAETWTSLRGDAGIDRPQLLRAVEHAWTAAATGR